MNFIKQNASILVICLLEILIGILLLINPTGFAAGIIVALGIILAVCGIVSCVSYFVSDPVEASLKGSLAKGLIMLSAGVFFVFRSQSLINAFPILTIFFGIVVLIFGLYKVQWFADALRLNTGKWFLHLLSAVVSIICAVIILANPFASMIALWMFLGISLIVEAVIDVIGIIMGRIAA